MEDKIASKKMMTVHDCEICEKYGLANHINTVHEGNKLSFKCKDCSALLGDHSYITSALIGGRGVRKCQFLLILSTKNMLT